MSAGAKLDTVTRAICAEWCAYRGDPPCWRDASLPFPPSACDEPGCEALAMAALAALAPAPPSPPPPVADYPGKVRRG